MILHVVLFQPRENLAAEHRERLMQDLRHAAATIPSVRRFRIGARITHGHPGYEQLMHDRYELAAVIEFDDREGLLEYLRHPSHQALGAHFTISAQRALAYDYEVEDLT